MDGVLRHARVIEWRMKDPIVEIGRELITYEALVGARLHELRVALIARVGVGARMYGKVAIGGGEEVLKMGHIRHFERERPFGVSSEIEELIPEG
jgi:hypothetical protein